MTRGSMAARGSKLGLAFALTWIVTWMMGVSTDAAAAPARSWEAARTDEAQALRAERDALRKTLNTTRAGTQAAKATLRKEIEALSEKLTRAQVRNSQLEQDLPSRERSRSLASQDAQMEELLSRMAIRAGESIPEDEDARGEALPRWIRAALTHIESRGQLHVAPDGEYFDASGALQRAPILHVGGVAASVWDGTATPLITTPDGLRVATGVRGQLQDDAARTVVTMVLVDPADPPVLDAFVDAGWRQTLDDGGPVMWVLLLIGAIAALIVIERTLALLWARQRWRYEQRRFASAVSKAHTSTLLHVQGWIAKPLVIAAAARCPSCSTTVDVDVEERATQALMIMREQLQRRLSLVNVAAGVAPLLGLLGTVTGMIHTFSVVTDTGTAEPQLLAAGISEALLTTQFGLAIAIPAYLAHALLSRGARRILASAEQAVLAYLHGGDGHGHEHHSGHKHDHDHDHDHAGHKHDHRPKHHGDHA